MVSFKSCVTAGSEGVGTEFVYTSQPVRDVDFEFNVAKEHGEGHGEVGFRPEGNVAVSGLEAVQRENPLTQELAVLVVNAKTEDGQVREDHFAEEERLFIVDGIEAVGRDEAGPELFADGVRWEAVHVHFHVGSYFLVRQELAGDDLCVRTLLISNGME